MRDGSGFIDQPMRASAVAAQRERDAAGRERVLRERKGAWNRTIQDVKAQEAREPNWWETGKYKPDIQTPQASRDAVTSDPYMTAAQLEAQYNGDPGKASDAAARLVPARPTEQRFGKPRPYESGISGETPLSELSKDPMTALQQVYGALRSLSTRLEPFLRRGRRTPEAIPTSQTQRGELIDYATSVLDRQQAVAQGDSATLDNAFAQIQPRESWNQGRGGLQEAVTPAQLSEAQVQAVAQGDSATPGNIFDQIQPRESWNQGRGGLQEAPTPVQLSEAQVPAVAQGDTVMNDLMSRIQQRGSSWSDGRDGLQEAPTPAKLSEAQVQTPAEQADAVVEAAA